MKWMVFFTMILTLLTESCSKNLEFSHVITQKGSNFPLTQLAFFAPLGYVQMNTIGGETALLKKYLAQSHIATIIENYGGNFSIEISPETFVLHITLLTDQVKEFLKEIKQPLINLKIDENLFNNIKNQVLSDIDYINSDADSKSYKLFIENIFNNHPYGKFQLGTQDTINKITIQNIKELWQDLFTKNYIYFIANTSEPNIIDTYLTEFYNQLPNKQQEAQNTFINAAPVSLYNSFQEWNEQDPQLTQSFINIGFLMPALPLEQKHFIMFLKEIIGGGFNSRLFKILRAENSLTYSPYANYSSYTNGDLFYISYSTTNSKKSIEVVQSIIDDLKTNGITQEEFEISQKLLYTNLLKMKESNISNNRLIVNDILYKRKLGSIQVLEKNIRKSNPEDLNNFIKNLFNSYPPLLFTLRGFNA